MTPSDGFENIEHEIPGDVENWKPRRLQFELTEKKQLSIPGAQWLATEKRLVQKLDCTLVPILWLLCLFNYIDRNNIA